MAEEQTQKRKGGWPLGKPRVKKAEMPAPETVKAAADRAEMPRGALAKMKARPNWDDDTIGGVGADGVDRLKIPQDIVNSLQRDGVALQWITRSVRGQETPMEVSKFSKGGWTPVHQSDFDGLLDGMFMPKGVDDVICVEDCMLVARPVEIHEKAKRGDKRRANEPLRITEEALGRGIPGVTGGDHPTATRGNSIKKSYERIEIPE